ncbi:hypothetical protein R3P38DRAFT_15964 [Favolaschia claudopus]|uniref:MYND-type domain-containing protein n=1 Tax=Favolaschia claudopus TaxID=2862362 RepID=A0AAW0EFZ3_9AGAR
MPSTRPHLPAKFLDELLAEPWMKDQSSFIFSKDFHDFRSKLADGNYLDISAETTVPGYQGGFFRDLDSMDLLSKSIPIPHLNSALLNPAAVDSKEVDKLYEGYSLLHMAVDETDPALLCEMIRQGALIEKPNDKGQTPLLLALKRIWDVSSLLRAHAIFPLLQGDKAKTENALRRLRYIARTLVEQHADVNSTITCDGKVVSSLHIACAARDWDLLALLLDHGANAKPTSTCVDARFYLKTAEAMDRFTTLVVNAKNTRPQRQCPCFSGRAMSDCHAREQPYPEDFTCRCGSMKAYGKCCKARDIQITEIWDEGTHWIQPSHKVTVAFGGSDVPPVMRAFLEFLYSHDHAKMEEIFKKVVPQAMFNPELRDAITECMEIGFRNKITDPAFTFAYFETKCYPWPQGRATSKFECRQKQKEWNVAVDKYIASGSDPRQRFEIERAAKVGVSLGAMIRVCEAKGCDKIEGRDIEKIATCGRCKISFYCGQACQKAAWPEHKKMCGNPQQIERPLPSQLAMRDYMRKNSPAFLMNRLGPDFYDHCEERMKRA